MKNPLRYISEYFFGSETRKFYQEERIFYRENVLNPNSLESLLRFTDIEEKINLITGKAIPNLLDIAAICYWTIAKDPVV